MAYFKLQLATSCYTNLQSSLNPHTIKMLCSTISEFYSQTDSNKTLQNFTKELTEQQTTQLDSENSPLTNFQHNSFSFSYDEKISIHANGKKELSFSMTKTSMQNGQWKENPFTSILHVGSKLVLTDKYNNQTFFTVTSINYKISDFNIVYNVTCSDSFSYELTRQNNGYTLTNDGDSKNFIGARNIDYWTEHYIVPDCHITYKYIPLNKGLYLDQDKRVREFSADTLSQLVAEHPMLKIIKRPYSKQNYGDFYRPFTFAVDGSSALNALISVANSVGMQVNAAEYIIPNSNTSSSEFGLFFWYTPTKQEEASGLKYSPLRDIQDFNLSFKGDALTTILNVQANEKADGELNTLLPQLPFFFRQLFLDNDLWNHKIVFNTGMFSSIVQHYSMTNGDDGKTAAQYYNTLNRFTVNTRCNHQNITRLDSLSLEQKQNFFFQQNLPFLYESRIYIPLVHQDFTPFKIPTYYEHVNFYYNGSSTKVTLKYGSEIVIKDGSKKQCKLVVIYRNRSGEDIIATYGRDRIPHDAVLTNVCLVVDNDPPPQSQGGITLEQTDLFVDFRHAASDEELEFARIADACPWLENKLIDLTYFQRNKLLSKYDYAKLVNLLVNDLRVINGHLLVYSTDYYQSIHKKTEVISRIINDLDSLGAAFSADVIDKYAREGRVDDLYHFQQAYNNVFVSQSNNKTPLLALGDDLTEYGNKYFRAQQTFLKSIYNFRKYWDSPTFFKPGHQLYTDTITLENSYQTNGSSSETVLYSFPNTQWTNVTNFDRFTLKDENEASTVKLYSATWHTEIAEDVTKANFKKFFALRDDKNRQWTNTGTNTVPYSENCNYYDFYFDDILNSEKYEIAVFRKQHTQGTSVPIQDTSAPVEQILQFLATKNLDFTLVEKQANNADLTDSYWQIKKDKNTSRYSLVMNGISENRLDWLYSLSHQSETDNQQKLILTNLSNVGKLVLQNCDTIVLKQDKQDIEYSKITIKPKQNINAINSNTPVQWHKLTLNEITNRYILTAKKNQSNDWTNIQKYFTYRDYCTYKPTSNFYWGGAISCLETNKIHSVLRDPDHLFFWFSQLEWSWFNKRDNKNSPAGNGLAAPIIKGTLTVAMAGISAYLTLLNPFVGLLSWGLTAALLDDKTPAIGINKLLRGFLLYRDMFPLQGNIYYRGWKLQPYGKNQASFVKGNCSSLDSHSSRVWTDYLSYLPVQCTTVDNHTGKYKNVIDLNLFESWAVFLLNKEDTVAKPGTEGRVVADWQGNTLLENNLWTYNRNFSMYDALPELHRTTNILRDFASTKDYADIVWIDQSKKKIKTLADAKDNHILYMTIPNIQQEQERWVKTHLRYKNSQNQESSVNDEKYKKYESTYKFLSPTYSNLKFWSNEPDEAGYYYKDSYFKFLKPGDYITKTGKYHLLVPHLASSYRMLDTKGRTNGTPSKLSLLFCADGQRAFPWQIVNGKCSAVLHYDLRSELIDSFQFETSTPELVTNTRITIPQLQNGNEVTTFWNIGSANSVKSYARSFFQPPFGSLFHKISNLWGEDNLDELYTKIEKAWSGGYPSFSYNTETNCKHFIDIINSNKITKDKLYEGTNKDEWLKEEMEADFDEMLKHLYYINYNGQYIWFFIIEEQDYHENINAIRTSADQLKIENTLLAEEERYKPTNWYDKITGDVADFTKIPNLCQNLYYSMPDDNIWYHPTEWNNEVEYYAEDELQQKYRVYTLRQLINNAEKGPVCYLQGSVYQNTSLSADTKVWDLSLKRSVYESLKLRKKMSIILKINPDTVQPDASWGVLTIGDHAIEKNTIWDRTVSDAISESYELIDIIYDSDKRTYTYTFRLKDTNDIKQQISELETSFELKNRSTGQKIKVTNVRTSQTETQGPNVILDQTTVLVSDVLQEDTRNIQIDIGDYDKATPVFVYYNWDLDKMEVSDQKKVSDPRLCIKICGKSKSKPFADMTNGTFWMKYHTFNTEQSELNVLFEHAAMIETELTMHWEAAYAASLNCEYFLPERWQDTTQESKRNYFSKQLYSPTGTLSSVIIPVVEIYTQDGKYPTGRMPKYQFRYNSGAHDISITSKDIAIRATPAQYSELAENRVITSSDQKGWMEILDSSLSEWNVEKIENAYMFYYRVVDGGTLWKDVLPLINAKHSGFDLFSGLNIMTFKALKNQFFEKTATEYWRYQRLHNQKWEEIYTKFPGILLEQAYTDENAQTSTELLESAQLQMKDIQEPEKEYSITIIDVDNIQGYHGQEVTIGTPIEVNSYEYYTQTDDLQRALSQMLFVSDISYSLRSDTDVSLTVNTIKYQDKLIKRLVKLIK